MNRILPLLMLSSLLAGCSGETDTGPVEQGDASQSTTIEDTSSVDTLDRAQNDPELAREAMNDPAQREALMQSMRERRGRMGEDGRMANREELRERMRERRAQMGVEEDTEGRRAGLRERQLAATAWWDDPDISEQLELSQDQRERIGSASREREAGVEASRAALVETQRHLMEALRSGERGQIESLLVKRHEATSALGEAELAWQRQLLEALSDQQLSELASQNPQVLIGRHRPM